jgi:trk system potassium uptake protein TrkA
MNIVIAGVGEVGRELAWSFWDRRNNITVVDREAALLERLRDRLDVMTVPGDCAVVGTLRAAQIEKADLLIAATGDDASNVLACAIGRHFHVPMTVCRLACTAFFSSGEGWNPAALGIDHMIFPEAECVAQVLNAVEHQAVVERVVLSYRDAECTALRLSPESSMAGCALRDFPDLDLLRRVRFCAIVRQQRLVMPRGNTVFMPGDEVYVAGPHAAVVALYDRFWPEGDATGPVIVAGANRLSLSLVLKLCDLGLEVRVIERDEGPANHFLDALGRRAMLLRGQATDADVLEEAGVHQCRAFISILQDDEDNILGSILAKQQGARKVITVTNKAEYMDIVPALVTIDAGFSPRQAAANSVLNIITTNEVRVQAILTRTRAYIYELWVQPGAPLCGQRLADSRLPDSAVLALIIRRGETLAATGDAIVEEGDRLVAVATPDSVRTFEKLLTQRSLL